VTGVLHRLCCWPEAGRLSDSAFWWIRGSDEGLGSHAGSPSSSKTATRPRHLSSQKAISYTTTGHKVVTHSSSHLGAGRARLQASGPDAGRKLSSGLRVLRAQPTSSKMPSPAVTGPAKRCRNCAKVKPLNSFLIDKRLEDGLMHICAECAQLKGLSGKFASQSCTTGAAGPSCKSVQGKGPTAPMRNKPPGEAPHGRKASPATAGWGAYSSSSKAPGRASPVVTAVRSGTKRTRDADGYEADFVVEDASEGDWRSELASVCVRPLHSTCWRGCSSRLVPAAPVVCSHAV
jgi:hypothetical protein